MNNDLIPYPEALRLKKVGFNNVPCFGVWYNIPEDVDLKFFDLERHFSSQPYETQYYANKAYKNAVLAPTYRQAFQWLLTKLHLYGIILPTITASWTFKTMYVVEGLIEVPRYNYVVGNDYSTFQEAELACLKRLIEFVEQTTKNNG